MSSETPSSDTAPSSAAQDAKARREARKARILASGSDRLARITKTGRGDEAEKLYGDAPKPLGNPSATAPASSSPATGDGLTREQRLEALTGEDPEEIDISRSGALGSFGAGEAGASRGLGASTQQQQQPPRNMQEMMAAIQAAMAGGGLGGGPPGAPGQEGAPQMPFDFSAMFGGGAGGPGAEGAAAPGFAPTASTATWQRGKLDKAFDLIRVVIFALFGLSLVNGILHHSAPANAPSSLVAGLEKHVELGLRKAEHISSLQRWASLAHTQPDHTAASSFGSDALGLPVGGVPIFWLFISLEIALQSTRIMLFRSRPPPPSLLRKVTPFLPPAISSILLTLTSYVTLFNAFVNDIAVVVFCIGMGVMYARWRADSVSSLATAAAGGLDGVGQLAAGVGSVGQAAADKVAEALGGAGNFVGEATKTAAEAVAQASTAAAEAAMGWVGDAPPAPLQGAL